MAMITTTGTHHVRLTVSDIQRSRKFYEKVFGFMVAAEAPGSPDDPSVRADPFQLNGGVIMRANGMMLGLRPVGPAAGRFDCDRAGLDHLSFTVESMDHLERAATRLDEAGIRHGDIAVMAEFGVAVLAFEDPDGIQLELTAPV